VILKIFCYFVTFSMGTGFGMFLAALMTANTQDERFKRWLRDRGE
jgi:cytochrome bd-type quinol oxidase subunit 2